MIASHSTTWTGVPEPSSITLAGLAGLALLRRRR
ncbi:PEP-CTERM sorting domain-containing protein [Akkermansiaceae bacterium]|nr:PEP-CTERM sorting domain-containing protein [Akkermansiaceae bacterium]